MSYLLTSRPSHLHTCSYIRPTPMNAIVVCFATWPQLHHRAFISRPTDLIHVSFGRSLLMSGWSPAYGNSWNGGIMLTCPIHLQLSFFTANEMGIITVRSWSSALDIVFCQNMCRKHLRHLFWNTSSMWHIPLVTFQASAAYSSTLSTLLLKMRILFSC